MISSSKEKKGKMYTLELTFTEPVYRDDDNEYLGDFISHDLKFYKTTKGWQKTYNYWKNNEHAAIKMIVKLNNQIIAEFIRDTKGNVVHDVKLF